MMFYEKFENRLEFWYRFRQDLEDHPDPLNKVIQFWNRAPISTRTYDPFDRGSWPGAWKLIEENNYCDFSKTLAIYYTLSLTDRFQESTFVIAICLDKNDQSMYYLLFVDDMVIGYLYDRYVHKKDLPSTLRFQENYVMSPQQDH